MQPRCTLCPPGRVGSHRSAGALASAQLTWDETPVFPAPCHVEEALGTRLFDPAKGCFFPFAVAASRPRAEHIEFEIDAIKQESTSVLRVMARLGSSAMS